jgi:hypothetical protein
MRLAQIRLVTFVFCIYCGTVSGQIPGNIDSIRLKYDSALSAGIQRHHKLTFAVEINEKPVSGTRKSFGYLDLKGVKSKFTLNKKNEAWSVPVFKTDSVKLFYSKNGLTVSSNYLKSSTLSAGGKVYFGRIDGFRQLADRFDKDEEFNTDISNHHRGLFAILSNTNVRQATAKLRSSFKLYYCVIQRGEGQILNFYIK